jgi:hypothetical protein
MDIGTQMCFSECGGRNPGKHSHPQVCELEPDRWIHIYVVRSWIRNKFFTYILVQKCEENVKNS